MEGTEELEQHSKYNECEYISCLAAGLAVEASEVGAGGLALAAAPHPLDDVIAIFTTLSMKFTQRDGMISAHNFTSMDDFDYIRVDDSKSFVKVWNKISRAVATKVGMPIHCRDSSTGTMTRERGY